LRADASVELQLVADLTQGRLQVLDGGDVLRTYRVVGGGPRHARLGTFQIRRVEWQPFWVPPDSPRRRRPTASSLYHRPSGRVRIWFGQSGFYIHGAADKGALLSPGYAGLALNQYDAVDLGRLLLDRSSPSRAASWPRRILNGATSTASQWLLQPIRLTIIP
jgi:hypothetical protein